MRKNIMKDTKGITLIIMVISMIVIAIILSTIVFTISNRNAVKDLDNLYIDLNILEDKVNIYYWKYGKLPTLEEYKQMSLLPKEVINPNDEGKYYIIDLNALENLSINTSTIEGEIFVINEVTHTIYFPTGLEVDGEIYYRLPENYTKVGIFPVGWNTEKIYDVVTETSEINGVDKERIVPIPKGYVVSQISGENIIADGLVIYEGTEPVTGTKNSESHITAMETRNQYVWIPIDNINDMVMCKSNASDSICNLVLQEDGTLKCEVHNSTDLCGRLYTIDKSYTNENGVTIWTHAMSFTEADKAMQIWSESVDREPDIITADENDSNYMKTAVISGKTADFQAQLINDFKEMATSVAKYGGFYISRYEAGENGESKKNQKTILAGCATGDGIYIDDYADPDSYIDVETWYGLYSALRNVNNNTASTHMIWGAQYDQIIKFIGAEAQVAHPSRNPGFQKRTGYDGDLDILKNIYDLECNNREFVVTAYGTSYRCLRGAHFSITAWRTSSTMKGYGPASAWYSLYPNTLDSYACSRITMYI